MGHGRTSRSLEFRVGWNATPYGLVASCIGASWGAAFRRNPAWFPAAARIFLGPVNHIEVFRRWLRAWMRKHRVELALTLRMTVAAVAG